MTAQTKPLFIEQGATFTLGFVYCQPGPTVDGVVQPGDPYDLTDWIARMQLRKNQQSPILIDASTENGKITLGGATGRIDIRFEDEDTDLLGTKSCKYDLELENPAGDVFRILKGDVTVDPNITQDSDDPVVGA